MSFDLSKAIESAEKTVRSTQLEAIVLGPSGAGKSTVLGTLGCKTLYLYTTEETHGVKAARTVSADGVIPICIDHDEKELSPDQAYTRLLEILNSGPDLKKMGIGAVVLDGMSGLEAIIRGTKIWKEECKSANGRHSKFDEGPATITFFRPVIAALKALRRNYDMHIAVTAILDVKEYGEYGDIIEAKPRLQSYAVCEAVIQQFGDVLVVSRMNKDGAVKHKFQFMTDLSRVSTDDRGVIKKAINYNPRLIGLTVQELPPFLDADFQKVLELRAKR